MDKRKLLREAVEVEAFLTSAEESLVGAKHKLLKMILDVRKGSNAYFALRDAEYHVRQMLERLYEAHGLVQGVKVSDGDA